MRSHSSKSQDNHKTYRPFLHETYQKEIFCLSFLQDHDDRSIQAAMTIIFNKIYDQDFQKCSFGFRPGLVCHNALATINTILVTGQHKVGKPDVIEELFIDKKTLPRSQYKKVGYESRQVFDIKITNQVTQYRAEILEDQNILLVESQKLVQQIG